jgi:hypothetical protein
VKYNSGVRHMMAVLLLMAVIAGEGCRFVLELAGQKANLRTLIAGPDTGVAMCFQFQDCV